MRHLTLASNGSCLWWLFCQYGPILPILLQSFRVTCCLSFAGVLLHSQLCIDWACWIEGIRETHLGISFYINTSSHIHSSLHEWGGAVGVCWHCCYSLDYVLAELTGFKESGGFTQKLNFILTSYYNMMSYVMHFISYFVMKWIHNGMCRWNWRLKK